MFSAENFRFLLEWEKKKSILEYNEMVVFSFWFTGGVYVNSKEVMKNSLKN